MRPLVISPFSAALATSLILTACSNIQPPSPSAGHIRAEAQVAPNRDIPVPVAATVTLARPKAAAKAESYSVSVRNIPVQDLLFALSRDAKLNVDIHPGISGVVTVNAIDQTLQQILTRISKQVDMRWELDGPNLVVMQDSPFLRNYRVDYVNMAREVSGTVSINTQIASTSTSATSGSSSASSGGNNSNTSVTSKAQNDFWKILEKNLRDILRETDKIMPEGSSETVIERDDKQTTTAAAVSSQPGQSASLVLPGRSSGTSSASTGANAQQQGTTVIKRTTVREAASIIVNPEAGVVVVRATSRQHEKVQEYLDMVLTSARRQVIIEATIAEVSLSDTYQQGINWQSLRSLRPGTPQSGFSAAQNQTGVPVPDPFAAAAGSFATPPGSFAFLLNYVAPGLGLSSTLSLLETFGKVKVLSSPKISVLNNQTAMLKVVDNYVYFQIKNDSTTTTTGTTNNFTSTAQSVSIGLVMSVTPQISENGTILLNVRPTISSLKGTKTDPTPGLGVANLVPEIQTREMESMLRLSDGEVAVMGGLMEDKINYATNQIPGVGDIPGIGNFFRNRNDTSTKTELVIFLKPTIIRDPSVNGDYRSFRDQLPTREFFADKPDTQQKTSSMTGTSAR